MVVALLAVAVVIRAADPKFFPDDPLLVDNDRLDTPTQPEEIELSDLFDRFGHIFATPGSDESLEALNVNTLDEVPDSSWFTNRHGARRMSIEELVRGPNTVEGPDVTEPWRIFKSKSQGLTPGFEITDGLGDRYIIKFDPAEAPELASGAELVSTKLFYALGYNTPENHVATFDPDRLEIEPGTTVEDEFGNELPLTPDRLRRLLRDVPRLPDGRMRLTASKYLDGVPIGPFRYFGTRSDDPNDVIPHEHRRELRGLRVFAAWLNHDDTRAHNTQDAWVEEDGQHYVRHHLLDFGSTLGSGSVEAQLPWLGYNYWLDLDLVKHNIRTFGFSTPEYHTITFPDFPSIGRIEADVYEPHEWRNDYPNPAFVRMTTRDAFWAAKILISFTAEELRAIVDTAEFSDLEAADYLHAVIVKRQRKTAAYYFGEINPLDRFQLTADALTFVNLAEFHDFVSPGTTYRAAWSTYDNATDTTTPLGDAVTLTAPRLPLPPVSATRLPAERFLMADIRSINESHAVWDSPVRIYLRPVDSGFAVVGIEREP